MVLSAIRPMFVRIQSIMRCHTLFPLSLTAHSVVGCQFVRYWFHSCQLWNRKAKWVDEKPTASSSVKLVKVNENLSKAKKCVSDWNKMQKSKCDDSSINWCRQNQREHKKFLLAKSSMLNFKLSVCVHEWCVKPCDFFVELALSFVSHSLSLNLSAVCVSLAFIAC